MKQLNSILELLEKWLLDFPVKVVVSNKSKMRIQNLSPFGFTYRWIAGVFHIAFVMLSIGFVLTGVGYLMYLVATTPCVLYGSMLVICACALVYLIHWRRTSIRARKKSGDH